MLNDARSDFENYPHALKGRWHGQKALILKNLAIAESRPDYFDRAIVEYTAASIHLEEGGFKQSGPGRLRGQAGLDDFLECKHIALKPGTIKR